MSCVARQPSSARTRRATACCAAAGPAANLHVTLGAVCEKHTGAIGFATATSKRWQAKRRQRGFGASQLDVAIRLPLRKFAVSSSTCRPSRPVGPTRSSSSSPKARPTPPSCRREPDAATGATTTVIAVVTTPAADSSSATSRWSTAACAPPAQPSTTAGSPGSPTTRRSETFCVTRKLPSQTAITASKPLLRDAEVGFKQLFSRANDISASRRLGFQATLTVDGIYP